MKTRHRLRMELIRRKFHDPPKDLTAWVLFALVMTAMRLLLSRPQELSPLPILNTLLLPLCCWAAVPFTLARLENRTWQYFRNTSLLGLMASAAALAGYLYVFVRNGTCSNMTTNHIAAILGSGIGTALAGGILAALAKYRANHPDLP